MRAWLAVVLCACAIPDKHRGASDGGGDGGGGRDGATGPLRCLGQPPPTTAPPQIALAVTTVDGMTGQPVASVALDGPMLPSGTTDAQGMATLMATTSGAPIDSFVTATGPSGYAISHQHPSLPYDQDAQLAVPLLSFSYLAGLASQGGTVYLTSKAQLAITVVDCDGHPLAGATVTAATGQRVYSVAGSPTPSATATDDTGVAYVFGADPGTFTVTARASNGAVLRGHDVMAPAMDWTMAAIQP